MPVRRKTVRSRKRKRVTRRVARVSRPRYNIGIPTKLRLKLSYVDTLLATTAASGSSYWTYQNSLFDPYVSVGGHQPYYFDQYTPIYGYCRVFGIGYNVQAQTVSTTGHLNMAVYSQTDLITSTSLSAVAERKGCKYVGFSNQYKAGLKGYMSVAHTWGVSKKQVSIDDQYAAAVTTDPEKKAYLHIQTFNPTAVALDVILTVRLTYYCEFFRPITVNQS